MCTCIFLSLLGSCCLSVVSGERKPPKPRPETNEQPKPPINNEHRPPRPTSGNDANINPNPDPNYQPPVYTNAPGTKASPDKSGFGDLGVRPIHAGGSATPSLERSYEGSQRESGGSDRFQGPNTSV